MGEGLRLVVVLTPTILAILIRINVLGDIEFAKLFQTPAIIISSYETARELMEKRSGNYSDRPPFTLIVEL